MIALRWHMGDILIATDEHWPDDGIPTRKDLAPGTARWSSLSKEGNGELEYVCPCGCSHVRHLPVTTADDRTSNDARGWQFDANIIYPTLTPSIHCTSHCGWHGYLTKGYWITV